MDTTIYHPRDSILLTFLTLLLLHLVTLARHHATKTSAGIAKIARRSRTNRTTRLSICICAIRFAFASFGDNTTDDATHLLIVCDVVAVLQISGVVMLQKVLVLVVLS